MGPGDGEVLAEHLDWLFQRGLTPVTVAERRRTITRLAAALPCPLAEASAADLRAWRAGLQLAPRTILAYVSNVHQFYAWAAARGRVAANPAAGLPVPRRPRLLPRPIGEDELLGALAAAPPRIRPWLVLAGWAGLRAMEIAGLRRENVFEATPVPVILVVSKGGDERLVPMSAFVADELVPVLPARGWVFRRYDGRPGPNAPWVVSRLANDHLHDCGSAATLHQLRHRFATQAYRVDRDLRAVQELLGHRHPDSTAGYAAYDARAAIAAVEAIPAPGRLRACS
jgi:integrase/recombinase XerC